MSRGLSYSEQFPQEARNALDQYLNALKKVYPESIGQYQVIPWPEYGEGSYLVKIPIPDDETRWMNISEHMADVGTNILAESDQLFIPTG